MGLKDLDKRLEIASAINHANDFKGSHHLRFNIGINPVEEKIMPLNENAHAKGNIRACFSQFGIFN